MDGGAAKIVAHRKSMHSENLTELLERYHVFKCQVLSDTVYAIQGLLRREEEATKVDYTKDATKALLDVISLSKINVGERFHRVVAFGAFLAREMKFNDILLHAEIENALRRPQRLLNFTVKAISRGNILRHVCRDEIAAAGGCLLTHVYADYENLGNMSSFSFNHPHTIYFWKCRHFGFWDNGRNTQFFERSMARRDNGIFVTASGGEILK